MSDAMTAQERCNAEYAKDSSNYFGGCPECGGNDGYVNIGRGHWFVCKKHKTHWFIGSNLFSTWKDETPEEQRRAVDFMFDENNNLREGWRIVDPILPEALQREWQAARDKERTVVRSPQANETRYRSSEKGHEPWQTPSTKTHTTITTNPSRLNDIGRSFGKNSPEPMPKLGSLSVQQYLGIYDGKDAATGLLEGFKHVLDEVCAPPTQNYVVLSHQVIDLLLSEPGSAEWKRARDYFAPKTTNDRGLA
jgi:ssDNA-binding Zn-finger/Zn-ribbon topoisomerase 1